MTRPIGIIPKGSKADRMVAQTAKIEAGHVYLPKEAPWLAEFLSELLGFPNARHDDQVDSVSQFLNWAAQRVVRDDRIALPASVGGQGRMRFDYH
jgi:predicted phage terminase large subunit-like protein